MCSTVNYNREQKKEKTPRVLLKNIRIRLMNIFKPRHYLSAINLLKNELYFVRKRILGA